MKNLAEIIAYAYPDAEWVMDDIYDYKTLVWLSGEKPFLQTILSKEADYLKTTYKKKRAPLYKNTDYIDALMKDAQARKDNGETLHDDLVLMLEHWNKIKTDNPK